MNSCQGKIYDYSDKQSKFGFLDIYNILTYKFYNKHKKTNNDDYITFLKKNSILNNHLEKIMIKYKFSSYKNVMNILEKILNERIIFLQKLKNKLNLFITMKVSFSNFEKLQKEFEKLSNNINDNDNKNEIFIDSLLSGQLIPNKNFSLYNNFSQFFKTTDEQSKQLISEYKNTTKKIILNKNIVVANIYDEIINELKQILDIQSIVKEMNTIFYISPYTNKIDANQLNIEINSIKYYSSENIKSITKNAYPIIKPITIYNENNKPIKLINVYSPKIWEINETNQNLEQVYNNALLYIKIQYLFDTQTENDIKNLQKYFVNISCASKNKELEYSKCTLELANSKQKKSVIETKFYITHRLFVKITKDFSTLFDEKFIFYNLTKNIKNNNNIFDIKSYKYFSHLNQFEIKHKILFELEKYMLQTLFTLSQNDNKDDKIIIKKLFKTLNLNKTKLNELLFELIQTKMTKSIDTTFKDNKYGNEKSIINNKKKIMREFAKRNKKEKINFKKNLKKILKLKKNLIQVQNNISIFYKINESENIRNEIKQIQIQLINDGEKLVKQYEMDLLFINKINKFIPTLINDILILKDKINIDLLNFKKVVKNILIKISPKFELTKDTLNLIDGEDLELDYFNPEIFFIFLSYMSDSTNNSSNSKHFMTDIYHLFIRINDMKQNLNPNFNCFEDIGKILETKNEYDIDYASDIWMWESKLNDKWIVKNNKIINERKNFLLSYPYVFTKTSELSKYTDISPCILKWLTEDDIIFIEMAKNFKSTKDNESMNFLLNTIDKKQINSLMTTYNKFLLISKFFSEVGTSSYYNKNGEIINKYRCFLPNKIEIDDSHTWEKILQLNSDIDFFEKQVLINSLIQINLLENLSNITNITIKSNDKSKQRKLNQNAKISLQILMEKLYQFIGFLYQNHIEKYLTERSLQKENILKNKVKENENFVEDDILQDYGELITDIDDIF